MSLLLLLVHCVRVCAVCGCGMVDIMTLRFVLTPSPFLPLCPPLGGSHLWFYIDPIMFGSFSWRGLYTCSAVERMGMSIVAIGGCRLPLFCSRAAQLN